MDMLQTSPRNRRWESKGAVLKDIANHLIYFLTTAPAERITLKSSKEPPSLRQRARFCQSMRQARGLLEPRIFSFW